MTPYDKHQVPQVRQELSKSERGKGEVSRPTKTALVLAGGGITGGVYQLGVLRALDDLLLNRSTLDFDIYQHALSYGQFGLAAAESVYLLALVAVILVLASRLRKLRNRGR